MTRIFFLNKKNIDREVCKINKKDLKNLIILHRILTIILTNLNIKKIHCYGNELQNIHMFDYFMLLSQKVNVSYIAEKNKTHLIFFT